MGSQEQRLQAQLDKLKASFATAQNKPLQATGVALVTFNYARHKQNMVIDHARSLKLADTIFAPAFIRNFQSVTGMCRCFLSSCCTSQRAIQARPCVYPWKPVSIPSTWLHTVFLSAGGLFSRAPRAQVTSKGQNVERFVTVQRAPEPADLWWENATTASSVGFRRFLSWMAYLILVAVSCGIQGLLTYLAEQARFFMQWFLGCFTCMLLQHHRCTQSVRMHGKHGHRHCVQERQERVQTSRVVEMGSDVDGVDSV